MTDDGESTRIWNRKAGGDFILIGLTLLITYVIFLVLALLGGLDFNGVMSSLERVTFFAAVFSLLVLALNLQWGYAGLFNIGVAGFMAIGMYTMAISTVQFGVPYPVGILLGMLVAGLAGAVVALPALRLRADYLAIVTLAFAEIVRLVFQSQAMRDLSIPWITIDGRSIGVSEVIIDFGGQRGPDGITADPLQMLLYKNADESLRPEPNWFGEWYFSLWDPVAINDSTAEGILYGFFLILMVGLLYWLLVRIGRSPFGRVLTAIREDETVARALGKDTRIFKIKAFAVGSAVMGLAAMLWYLKRGGGATPDNFMPELTFFVFVALIIGGAGSNTGSVIGGIVFGAILYEGPNFVERLVRQQYSPESNPQTIFDAMTGVDPFLAYTISGMSALRIVLLGVVLVILIQTRPAGLLGERKEIASGIDLEDRYGDQE